MAKNFDDEFARVFGQGSVRATRPTPNQPSLDLADAQERTDAIALKISRCSKCGVELPARVRSCFQCNAPLEGIRSEKP